jgi:hypothetical protein
VPDEPNAIRRGARVRPYAVTGGRTEPGQELPVEIMVSVPHYDPELSRTLLPEARALYERARTRISVAELCAELSLPLGMVRVLVGDLAAEGALRIHQTKYEYEYDQSMLERILDGLSNLST